MGARKTQKDHGLLIKFFEDATELLVKLSLGKK